jgi:dihydrodiol dehydrogenase / D-xylose 1-dehydrogenase (NADP)
MEKRIRWGILGTGYIARKFAQALSYLPEAELYAVGSRTRESAKSFADEYQVPRAHSSYQALVEDPLVDVVYVATLNNLHRENCLAALQAGKPVLCEKPFMVNSSEAVEVINCAREKRLFLMEALWTRFIPAFQKARQMWESGIIGDVRVVSAEFGFLCDRTPPAPLYDLSLAGGSLLDIGAYPISLAHIAFGEPDSIASLAYLGASGVDEQTGMLLGYRGGQIGLGYSSFVVDSPKEATIVGTSGYIRIHPPFYCPSEFSLHLNGKEAQVFSFPYLGNGWNYEAVEVMDCLRAGKLESGLAPHAESLALMRTMDRIRVQIGLKYPGEK